MSGKRTGRRVKPATRLSVPGVVFAVMANETDATNEVGTGLSERFWSSADIAVRYRRGNKWSAARECRVNTPEALREVMDDWSIPGRQNWVIAPSAADVLTLSGWFSYAEARGVTFGLGERVRGTPEDRGSDRSGIRVSQIMFSGRCDLLTYSDRGKKWRWIGARNYWPDGWDSRGTGRRSGDNPQTVPTGAKPGAPRGDVSDANRLCARFVVLCQWWGRIATAALGSTAAQLAWGILRSDASSRALCTHNDDDVHRLERCAAHGGRASVWYCGEVGANTGHREPSTLESSGVHVARTHGPVTHVDVTSMYPALLRDRTYPLSLRHVYGEMRPSDVLGLADGGGVIARVTVRSTAGEYPHRRGDRTIYPIGTFTTTLAGPDLSRLRHDGEILKVHMVAVYNMGRPFQGAMTKLLDERGRAKLCGDKDASAFAKLVANSLGGRLALHQGGWVRDSERDEPGRWGEYHSMSTVTGTGIRWRYLCGACWRWDDTKEARGPHTSAFAYLTAYGRQRMRAIRESLPARSVVSQDTDGLYLLQTAVDALRAEGISGESSPGQLRITASADSGRWYGPRHYRFGAQWVLSGFAPHLPPDSNLRFSYTSDTPLFGRGDRCAPTSVTKVTRTCAVPTDIDCGRVQEDGWVLPPHLLPSRA